MTRTKTCYIIAGPNGAGKTTFAMNMLPNEIVSENFINADLIAAGLSPFRPEHAAVEAGKLMLKRISSCVSMGVPFAFETTLSGRAYLRKIAQWQKQGYTVVLFYFSLPSVRIAIERVKYRVSTGGHNITEDVIRRRFLRSSANLDDYKARVNSWAVFDSSAWEPKLVDAYNYE